ncbi:MAG: DUF1844 domain-containing protein [Acidobacteriaceae bacterium]|nr:DUF1844 domain-containing protein [Acidobacteriaceae bacterium]
MSEYTKPESNKPFVVTDRRKFTSDGTPRPDADPSPAREPRAASAPVESAVPSETSHHAAEPIEFKSPHAAPEPSEQPAEPSAVNPNLPPPPTASEMEQAHAAYKATTDHLETAVRAANPGMDHPPAMSFAQIVQSIYMTAIIQLGGNTQPGQQPKIDLMGARQSIDMLAVIAEKTRGNLTEQETRLLDTSLFEIRMGFLEVTQALTRSAASRQPPPPGAGPIPPGRPTIVR